MSLYQSTDKAYGDSDDNIIEIENVQKTYLLGIEGVPALRGVSLKIKKGEFVIIYGTSGGGKTSLLNIIGTIDKPTKGYLSIVDSKIRDKTSDETLADIRLKRMGFVFQTFNLLSTMTALENVEMPMILKGSLSSKARRNRARDLLAMVGMEDRVSHVPSQLSGGEQQRVTIARAIANKPDILLLDEPTGDLDSVNTNIVMDLLHQLNQEEKITMVMVTHDPNLKHAAHRIVWMRDGKIAKVENIEENLRNEFWKTIHKGVPKNKNVRSQGLFIAPEEEEEEEDEEEEEEYTDGESDEDDIEYGSNTELRQPSSYEMFGDADALASCTAAAENMLQVKNTLPQERKKELFDMYESSASTPVPIEIQN